MEINFYKRFEVELSKKHLRKAGYGCNALLAKKIDFLLNLQGKPLLGFSVFEPPEMGWLIKVNKANLDSETSRSVQSHWLVGM